MMLWLNIHFILPLVILICRCMNGWLHALYFLIVSCEYLAGYLGRFSEEINFLAGYLDSKWSDQLAGLLGYFWIKWRDQIIWLHPGYMMLWLKFIRFILPGDLICRCMTGCFDVSCEYLAGYLGRFSEVISFLAGYLDIKWSDQLAGYLGNSGLNEGIRLLYLAPPWIYDAMAEILYASSCH